MTAYKNVDAESMSEVFLELVRSTSTPGFRVIYKRYSASFIRKHVTHEHNPGS